VGAGLSEEGVGLSEEGAGLGVGLAGVTAAGRGKDSFDSDGGKYRSPQFRHGCGSASESSELPGASAITGSAGNRLTTINA